MGLLSSSRSKSYVSNQYFTDNSIFDVAGSDIAGSVVLRGDGNTISVLDGGAVAGGLGIADQALKFAAGGFEGLLSGVSDIAALVLGGAEATTSALERSAKNTLDFADKRVHEQIEAGKTASDRGLNKIIYVGGALIATYFIFVARK